MKGCTLAEQHKGRVTDLFKASVWHLFSAGGTEDIMLDHAQPKGKEKEKKVKEKLCFFILLRFKRAHAVLVEGRLIPAC